MNRSFLLLTSALVFAGLAWGQTKDPIVELLFARHVPEIEPLL